MKFVVLSQMQLPRLQLPERDVLLCCSSFGSPLVAGGRVWIVNRAGALYQLNLETGEQVDVTRVQSGSVWAAPLCDANYVFLFGQKGTTSVLTLDDGEEISTNVLWASSTRDSPDSSSGAGVQYAAAAADGYLLIRCGDQLFAIR